VDYLALKNLIFFSDKNLLALPWLYLTKWQGLPIWLGRQISKQNLH